MSSGVYPQWSGYSPVCPKCASGGVESIYQEPGRYDVEHLLRVCLGCGYLWREQCADA